MSRLTSVLAFGIALAAGLLIVCYAGAQDFTGPVYARSGTAQVEAAELARWQAYARELRQDRDAKDAVIADLRVLLERALAELAKAREAAPRPDAASTTPEPRPAPRAGAK